VVGPCPRPPPDGSPFPRPAAEAEEIATSTRPITKHYVALARSYSVTQVQRNVGYPPRGRPGGCNVRASRWRFGVHARFFHRLARPLPVRPAALWPLVPRGRYAAAAPPTHPPARPGRSFLAATEARGLARSSQGRGRVQSPPKTRKGQLRAFGGDCTDLKRPIVAQVPRACRPACPPFFPLSPPRAFAILPPPAERMASGMRRRYALSADRPRLFGVC